MFNKGDKGPKVVELQNKLLSLGQDLPRWGADGDLGDETLAAVNNLLDDYSSQYNIRKDQIVTDEELAFIDKMHAALGTSIRPGKLIDYLSGHSGEKRIRKRAWGSISGITLHQTACPIGA